MRFVAAIALLTAMIFVTVSGSFSQEKKDAPSKVKGQLPKNWSKLELSPDQKSAIYKTQARYNEEIGKMKEKIRDMQAEELREMVKILTPEQKKRLEELTLGERSKDSPTKEGKEKAKDGKDKDKKDKG